MNIKTNIDQFISETTVIKSGSRTATIYLTFDYLPLPSSTNTILSVLYTDLLLSGTKSSNRSDIQHSLKKIGADIQVSLKDRKVIISAQSLDINSKKLLAILREILQMPTFKVNEFKRAKASLLNNLELAKENARLQADNDLKNAFYAESDPEFSYKLTDLIKSLDLVSLKDFRTYHDDLLQHHWSITVSGNKKTTVTIVKELQKLKGNNAAIAKIERVSLSKPLMEKKIILTEIKSKQNIEIAIGGQLPLNFDDKELPAFIFGLAVLGKWGGFSGRLMSTVREKEGLTYGIYAKTEKVGKNSSGYWRIMTFFSPKEVEKGLTSTLREIKLMHDKGINKSELARFRVILKTSATLIFDSLSSVTGLVHANSTAGVTWDDYQEFQQKLGNCTQKEVNQVIKKYLDPTKIVISAAGPVANVKSQLLKFNK